MPIPCVPTLGATTFLTDPSEIIAYVVRHFCAAPQSASNTYFDITYSLGDILSRYSYAANAVITPITTALMQILTNIFGTTGFPTVTVTTSFDTDTTYTITIFVQVLISGVFHTIDPTISVSNGTIRMTNDIVANATAITE